MTFTEGARVTFTENMLGVLLSQQTMQAGRRWLTRLAANGMQVQDEPRPGRVNVRFRVSESEPWSYRTYSASDLVCA